MIDTYRKIFELLSASERSRVYILFGMILLMGLIEALGVASIMPFMAVLSDPEKALTNNLLSTTYNYLEFTSTNEFLFFLGIVVFTVVVCGLAFKTLTIWTLTRFSYMRNYSLSSRLMRGYLNRPYSWFLNRHSADLGKTILSEVDQVVHQGIVPAMRVLAQFVVVVSLIVLIVVVDPFVALVAAAIIGAGYGLIYFVLKGYLSWIGQDRLDANRERFLIAQEAFGAIKDVKVMGLEDGYIRGFRNPASRFAHRHAASAIISELPRYIVEALALGGMLLLILVLLSSQNSSLGDIMPLLGLYAFAGTRLLPALHQLYNSLTKVRFAKPSLNNLHRDLLEISSEPRSNGERFSHSLEPIRLLDMIEVDDIQFTFPNAEHPALKDLNLIIKANTTVGIVGSTGAGKTTLVDILLGLLRPEKGKLLIDGNLLTEEKLRAWQRTIGYVPQHIFLTDDTVSSNIAFGVPEQDVDMDAVEHAARIAKLHQFVIDHMPAGYKTKVGERGVRLSGGQRQRVGIARALYHDPDVLIMDEATNALDSSTELEVIDAVHGLDSQKTIILVAHRLSTVRNCNSIFILESGRVTAEGTYEQLLARSEQFRKMASVQV